MDQPVDASAAWDRAYQSGPSWEIGRPQDAFAKLAAAGALSGTLLDIGCGTGEATLLAAGHGAHAVGIDVSGWAVRAARAKATRRGLTARFEIVDVLAGGALRAEFDAVAFDTVIDSGTFHMFGAGGRRTYAANIGAVMRPGGTCFLLCARIDPSRQWGPAGLDERDVAEAFDNGWTVTGREPAVFALAANAPLSGIDASLFTVVRDE